MKGGSSKLIGEFPVKDRLSGDNEGGAFGFDLVERTVSSVVPSITTNNDFSFTRKSPFSVRVVMCFLLYVYWFIVYLFTN